MTRARSSARDVDLWAYRLDFSKPGEPTDNAFIEAFNGRLRAARLNTHWFLSLEDAREKLERWRRQLQRGKTTRPFGNKARITLLNHPVTTTRPSD